MTRELTKTIATLDDVWIAPKGPFEQPGPPDIGVIEGIIVIVSDDVAVFLADLIVKARVTAYRLMRQADNRFALLRARNGVSDDALELLAQAALRPTATGDRRAPSHLRIEAVDQNAANAAFWGAPR